MTTANLKWFIIDPLMLIPVLQSRGLKISRSAAVNRYGERGSLGGLLILFGFPWVIRTT